jgi:hypothetical protein
VLLPGLDRHSPGAAARDAHDHPNIHIHTDPGNRHLDPQRDPDHHRDSDDHPDTVRPAIHHAERDPHGKPDAQPNAKHNLHGFTNGHINAHPDSNQYTDPDGHTNALPDRNVGIGRCDTVRRNRFG